MSSRLLSRTEPGKCLNSRASLPNTGRPLRGPLAGVGREPENPRHVPRQAGQGIPYALAGDPQFLRRDVLCSVALAALDAANGGIVLIPDGSPEVGKTPRRTASGRSCPLCSEAFLKATQGPLVDDYPFSLSLNGRRAVSVRGEVPRGPRPPNAPLQRSSRTGLTRKLGPCLARGRRSDPEAIGFLGIPMRTRPCTGTFGARTRRLRVSGPPPTARHELIGQLVAEDQRRAPRKFRGPRRIVGIGLAIPQAAEHAKGFRGRAWRYEPPFVILRGCGHREGGCRSRFAQACAQPDRPCSRGAQNIVMVERPTFRRSLVARVSDGICGGRLWVDRYADPE